MSGRFLLDTNITIAFLSGDHAVVSQVDDSDAYFVSSTIAGEMFYGAYYSASVDENIQRIDSFFEDAELVACDEGTSRLFGEIKASLRRMFCLSWTLSEIDELEYSSPPGVHDVPTQAIFP